LKLDNVKGVFESKQSINKGSESTKH